MSFYPIIPNVDILHQYSFKNENLGYAVMHKMVLDFILDINSSKIMRKRKSLRATQLITI